MMEKIPIRSLVRAPKDHLLVNFDFAQAESWVVAYLANEPTMKHILKTGDIHRETAQKAFANFTDEEWETLPKDELKSRRYTGKRYNHASAYRMGPYRAAEVINKDSDKPPYVTVTLSESKRYYNLWHSYYNLKPWWDEIEYQLNKNRTMVTPYGRILTLFDHWGNELFKKATAFVPQSTVADHMNGVVQDCLGIEGGLIKIHEKFVEPGYIRIINQSHDSILSLIPTISVLDICEQMYYFLLRPLIIKDEEFTIPVDCEIGERWGLLKEQKREGMKIDFSI